jgi:signal peptidase I
MSRIDPIKSYNVPYEAMEPTIRRNTEVKGDRSYYFQNSAKRWDVVVFLAPEISKLGPELGKTKISELGKCAALINAAADIYAKNDEIYRPQIYYVKRIIGLPGEIIQLTSNGIRINRSAVEVPSHLRELFSRFEKHEGDQHGFDPYQIPDDCVFLIGDNPGINVMDSRKHGPVPVANLEAKVVGVN